MMEGKSEWIVGKHTSLTHVQRPGDPAGWLAIRKQQLGTPEQPGVPELSWLVEIMNPEVTKGLMQDLYVVTLKSRLLAGRRCLWGRPMGPGPAVQVSSGCS